MGQIEFPTAFIPQKGIGDGWRIVAPGEQVKTRYQYFAFFMTPPQWILSSYFTSDNFINSGRSNYRAPASFHAWSEILPTLIKKYRWKWWDSILKIYAKLNG